MIMKKTEIEMYYEHGRGMRPAINVKSRNYPSTFNVADRLGCTEKQAEKALDFCWNSACECFWEEAQETVAEIFGKCVKVYSTGRSGGHLIVSGLPDVESWDAIAVSRWARLNRWCRIGIEYLSSIDYVIDEIEANKWHLAGAEQYNFIDKNGEVTCIAELKQEAIAAGFGPVVRA